MLRGGPDLLITHFSCPWCAIGLATLEQVLGNLQRDATVQLHVQPLELTLQMAKVS